MTEVATPWNIERHDCNDGSISYEIWDARLENRIAVLNDGPDEEGPIARACATQIVKAVNAFESLTKENHRLRTLLNTPPKPSSDADGKHRNPS